MLNIFNAIKYPFASLTQAQEDFPKLPKDLRQTFINWNNKQPESYPGDPILVQNQLVHLRKLIAEYHDDL